MPSTPIKITVTYVEPTEETLERQETAWKYVAYSFGKYLDREFYPKYRKAQRKALRESRREKAASAVTPAAGSEKTSCPQPI